MSRVIVAGGRDFDSRSRMREVMDKHMGPETVVVCGMAPGADRLAWDQATAWGIPIDEHPAKWDQYGKAAGARRNREMAKVADILVAVWDGKSPGTKDMITVALAEGLEVHVYRYHNV
jgi:glycerophosphoryl diester phosphodiesterase